VRAGWVAVVLGLARAQQAAVGGNATAGVTRDMDSFPACITDSDCKEEDGYKCFQYMCFPWESAELMAPYRSCKRRSDCAGLRAAEGGDGGQADCYRHQDRRNVFAGICLPKSQLSTCYDHKECRGQGQGQGLKCVNQVCGEAQYLEAIKDLGCKTDDYCKDLLLGTSCCLDISGSLTGRSSGVYSPVRFEWTKKCCSSTKSPVIPPKKELDDENIKTLDGRIKSFASLGMDKLICTSLDYSLLMKLDSCNTYRTTLPPPTITTVKPKKPKNNPKRGQTSSSPLLCSSVVVVVAALALGTS